MRTRLYITYRIEPDVSLRGIRISCSTSKYPLQEYNKVQWKICTWLISSELKTLYLIWYYQICATNLQLYRPEKSC